MVQNKGLIYKSPPKGWPIEGENIKVEDRPFDMEAAPPENGVTTKNYYVSFDPYQRGRMRSPEIKSYSPPFDLNEPITNSAVAKILKSNNPGFREGDLVRGTLPTEEYSTLSERAVTASKLQKLDNPYGLDPKLFIGALGMPGLTAYSSFYKIGEPKKGETIFISSASGAVGQIVGQLAKHEGLKVIGSVGSDEKLDFIKKDLAFDEGFNYKKESPLKALKRLAPNGIDIYFENVGGETLDAALTSMNDFGRVIGCGMISQYNNASADQAYGVKNLTQLIRKRLRMQGFIVSDPGFGPAYTDEHQRVVQRWIRDGEMQTRESVTEGGMDDAIKGFLGMLKGENFGKAILKIASLEGDDHGSSAPASRL